MKPVISGIIDHHCPYYMIPAVLHDQNISIESELNNLEKYLSRIIDCGFLSHQERNGGENTTTSLDRHLGAC